MEQRQRSHPLTVGILAHVDAGKTTLSEALLFESGVLRTAGRVDHRDTFLDTHDLERARGITIFSKQAVFSTAHRRVTLVDTPGHVDFAAEAERVMPVLDCAVVVISGADGVQAHTLTIWKMLEKYHVPVFLFLNKMDLAGADREALLRQLQSRLDAGCVPLSDGEAVATCGEAALEQYLETGEIRDPTIREMVAERKLFPCLFGSALKMEGAAELLDLLDTYAPCPAYGQDFGAKVYKISHTPKGERLTWLKVTGGALQVRDMLTYRTAAGEIREEKLVQLRQYSGEKFTAPDTVFAGELCAVSGLTETYAGQGMGTEADGSAPITEPVMAYRIGLPAGCDPVTVLPKLRRLSEEDPQLRIEWDGREIQAKIMGKVQCEILQSLIARRFSLDVTMEDPRICYRETIENTVEGVGHFEPLRHYAEVHLLLEPLPRGAGLQFATVCPMEVLDGNYQNLILTHITEKTHRGVLTGAPITDMKITLVSGRAHVKHTEGGDFRQATYRAIRQGLMQAKSLLLEPWYSFSLTVPDEEIGRAITDIRTMGGEFQSPESRDGFATLEGTVPASEVGDYAQTVAAYTHGQGQLRLTLSGYAPCHNAGAVIEQAGYDPEADLENTPDSVFCAHGAGFHVKWSDVPGYMHLESCLKVSKEPEIITRNLRIEDKELEAIMEREFGPVKRPLYRAPENRPAKEEITIRPPKKTALIVDGYNIIFAWDELAQIAKTDLDAARRRLCDILSSYAGFRKCELILVFDGYKVPGNPGEKKDFHNIRVVYTKENETGDAYMESLAAQIGNNYSVRVATSDGLVQLSSLRSGILRMSARELWEEIQIARKEMRSYY